MSIYSVAARAGLSIATVSRAFNAPDKLMPATLALVRQAADELGYMPNASARSLRSQRSRVLGVMLPTLLNPTFAECLQGIGSAAAAQGYAILPFTSDYTVEGEQRALRQLQAAGVDGAVLVVSVPAESQALASWRSSGLPYVLAYNWHPKHPCVAVDGEHAVADVVERLVALGHRRITMVSGALAASDRAQQRYAGYQRGMAAAGLAEQPLVELPFIKASLAPLTRLMTLKRRPSALVCSNDLLAIRCIRAAHLAGLQVPRELSVVGFDGIALGTELTPTLSSVAQPSEAIGRRCAQWLIDCLRRGQAPEHKASVLLPHALRDGESFARAG